MIAQSVPHTCHRQKCSTASLRRLKERAKAISDTWGSDSTQESLAAKLNDMGNKILVANGGR